jgi:predicted N-acetyltransferase YhbS
LRGDAGRRTEFCGRAVKSDKKALTRRRADLISAALAEAHGIFECGGPFGVEDPAVALTETVGEEPLFQIDIEQPADAAAVDAIVAQAFGPGRYAKTAERLREGSRPIAGLSFTAREDGSVVGTVRLWPVEVSGVRLAFLGPIAVEAGHRREGLGAALIERACAEAKAKGWAGVLLVGDEPYFGRFGFRRARLVLPGPVNPARVLLLELDPAATAALAAGPAAVQTARD